MKTRILIRATQDDKTVTIKYDLKVRSQVNLLISLDDGQHYTDTMKLTGNVNRIVPAGKNKLIRWQAFKDLGYGDYPNIRFMFLTEEKQVVKARALRCSLQAEHTSCGVE